GLVIAAAIAATLVTILIYYTRNIAGDGYYTAEGARFNEIALYVIAAVLFAGTIAAAFIIDKNSPPFSTRMIARAGVAVALSFAFSYVKLFQLPQGGAVTLASSLPIMLFAFSYGPKKGLMIGFVYGMLQAVQDPFIIHPAQFLLDYPVAFTMYGLAGAFVRTRLPVQVNFTLGAILSSAMRFAAHVVSGVFAFGAYAEGAGAENFLLYSLAYNSFVFVDVAIALALGILLLSNRAIRKLLIGAADEEKDVKSILKSDDPSPQNDAETDL
ncbi:MAG: energy-coupled thiamine transporter ThiT, partial [Clostridia bacterium]|nr:energy-coupled thiamine transporter ThiT [Clostridia bacterium]